MKRRWLIALTVGCLCIFAYFGFPYLAPKVLGWIYPDVVFRIPTDGRVLYITIDDAPSGATTEIMSVLAKHHVPATFFVIGSWVQSRHQLDQIREAGFTVGHHMWSTKPCSRLTSAEFRSSFDDTAQVLKGLEGPYFRPPSGAGTAEQMAYVKSHGLVPILGTDFPLDSAIQNPRSLEFLVKWLAIPGGIVIMHDGNKRGWTTAKVLDAAIPELKKKGYEFRALPAKGTNPAL